MDNKINIFQQVRERFNILDVAKDLGLRTKKIGGSYRADGLDGGENALQFFTESNTWFDHKLGISGDVTDLVARIRFNGDIKQALQYLLPDVSFGHIDRECKAKNEFTQKIERWHHDLFHDSRDFYRRALDYLHSRGITDDTIHDLKIGVKVENGSELARIVFPYWDDCGKNVLFFASRKYDYSGRGEDDHSPKYKYAPLEFYPFLKSSPLGLNSLSRKKDDTLVITEGVIDWLVLYQEGFSVLAFKDDKHWDNVLEKIKQFKKVILAYDSDSAGQNYTYKAAKVLLKNRIPFTCLNMLTKDVAEHYAQAGNLDFILQSQISGFNWFLQFILPKKNFDDLTVYEKEQAMNKCKLFIQDIAPYSNNADVHNILIKLKKYFPQDWIAPLFEFSRKGPSQLDIVEKVRLNHDFLFNPKIGFFEYRNPKHFASKKGIWKKVDDEVVQGHIMNSLGKFATGGRVSSILKLFKAHPDVHSETPIHEFNSLPLVSVLNGTLHIDIYTGEVTLKPHSMYDYVTVQLPVWYDPNAKCLLWREFIDTITNGRKDDAAVLQEFSGYPFLPHCKFQKALMLKGGGSNGKSVFFDIISAIFGGSSEDSESYISSTDPSKWGKDFRLMPLRNSWLNISYDMESDMRGSEGMFKKITAGEILEDSYKHKDAISFRTRSKLMMACNFFPTVNDTSDGFMRRWLIVELPMHFVEKDKVRQFTNDRELDPFLEDKLMKELPGILNWMIEGLQRLIKQGKFTHTAQQDDLINEFRAVNNPLYSFVDDNKEAFEGSDNGHIVYREQIFLKFSQWADKNKVQPIPSNRFYSNMRSIFKNMSIPFDEDNTAWIFYFRE